MSDKLASILRANAGWVIGSITLVIGISAAYVSAANRMVLVEQRTANVKAQLKEHTASITHRLDNLETRSISIRRAIGRIEGLLEHDQKDK